MQLSDTGVGVVGQVTRALPDKARWTRVAILNTTRRYWVNVSESSGAGLLRLFLIKGHYMVVELCFASNHVL